MPAPHRRRWLRYSLRTMAMAILVVAAMRADDQTTETQDAERIRQFLSALPNLDLTGQQKARRELDQAINENPRRPAWVGPLLKAIAENRASQSGYYYSVLHRMARADQAQFKHHIPQIANLFDPCESIQTWYAINLLLEVGPTAAPAADKLTELANDQTPRETYLRIRSIGALARIQPREPKYRETLLQELSNQQESRRMAAAAALGLLQVKDRDLVARLLHVAQNDTSAGARVIAAASAYELSGEAAPVIPLLVKALNEEDASVTVSPTSFSSWTPSHRHYAMSALGSMKGNSRVNQIDCR